MSSVYAPFTHLLHLDYMTTHPHVQILALVGLPGSGISTAVQYLRDRHVPSVYFGGVILRAMQYAGIERSPEAEQMFREQWRAEHGNDAVVTAVLPQIHDLIAAGQRRIVLDGLYSWTEYKILKHEFPAALTVVALTAPKHLRWRRLMTRTERPMTEAQAARRDYAEIEQLEKGGPIAAADYYVANDDDLAALQTRLDAVLREINFFA